MLQCFDGPYWRESPTPKAYWASKLVRLPLKDLDSPQAGQQVLAVDVVEDFLAELLMHLAPECQIIRATE